MNNHSVFFLGKRAGALAAVFLVCFLGAGSAWAAPPTTTVSFGRISSVSIEVRWAYKSGHPTYQIHRRTGLVGPYNLVGTKSNVTNSGSSIYLDDNDIQPQTEYCYKVLVCTADESSCSRLDDTTYRCVQTPALPPEYTISGRITDHNSINLSGVAVAFNDAVSTTDAFGGYRFENLPAGTGGTLVPAKDGYAFDPPSYSISNLSSSLTRDFTGTPTFGIPTGVTAQALSTSRIRISWNPVPDISSYDVRNDTIERTYLAGDRDTTAYEQSGLVADTTYCYRVRACDLTGCYPFSQQACATTDAVGRPPEAPRLDSPVIDQQAGTVALNWTASGVPDYYQVEFSGGGSSGSKIPSPPTATQLTLSKTEDGLQAGVTYQVVVKAHNSAGDSPASNSQTFLLEGGNPSNLPPVASCLSCPAEGLVGVALPFRIGAEDPDGDSVRLAIDWGDGNEDQSPAAASGTPHQLSHTYAVAGDYGLHVVPMDANGAAGTPLTYDVAIGTTPPPPPDYDNGHLLGDPDRNGVATPAVGFGVNAVTGNFFHREVDAALPGKEISFVYARYYNSQARGADTFGEPIPQPLGPGWSHAYHILLRVDTDAGLAQVIWGDGHRDGFIEVGGTWIGNTPGNFAHLAAVGDPGAAWELSTKGQTRYRFDAAGRLVAIVGRSGHRIALAYNTGGLLQSVTDTAGRGIGFDYQGGRLSAMHFPPGRTIAYGYDGEGRLDRVTDAAGHFRRYGYDTGGRLSRLYQTDQSAGSSLKPALQVQYDADGRVVKQDTGQTLSKDTGHYDFTWQGNNALRYSDPTGKGADLQWDDHQRVTGITPINAPGAQPQEMQYLAEEGPVSLLPQRIGDFTGHDYGLAYTGDGRGNLQALQPPEGSPYTFGWKNDDLDSITTAEGLTTKVTQRLADIGKPTAIQTSGPGLPAGGIETGVGYHEDPDDPDYGLLKRIDPPHGRTEIEEYAKDGQVKRIARYKSPSEALRTDYAYDEAGRLTSRRNHRGTYTCYQYDANDNLIHRVAGLANPCPADLENVAATPEVRHTRYRYDAQGRPIQRTRGYGGPRRHDTYYHYNANSGLLARRCDQADKRCIEFFYDGDGNLHYMDTPRGRRDYVFSNSGGLVRIAAEGQIGGANFGRIERGRYDADGNLISVSSCSGMESATLVSGSDCANDETERLHYSYDALGRVEQVLETVATNPTTEQRRTRYSYSADGRVTTVQYPDGSSDRLETDARGLLVKVVNSKDGVSLTTTAKYDDRGRVVEVTDPQGLVTTYSYDQLGRMLTRTDLQGTVTWHYDDANGSVTRTEPGGVEVVNRYDRLGQLVAVDIGEQLHVTLDHDELGRLVREHWDGAAGSGERSYSYGTDPDKDYGELVAVTGPFGQSVEYEYDEDGRLTKRRYAGIQIGYGYDVLDRIDAMTTPLGQFRFGYQDYTGALANTKFPNGITTNYQRNLLGELTGMATAAEGQAPFVAYTLDLDALGRRSHIEAEQPVAPRFVPEDLEFDFRADGLLADINGAPVEYDPRGNLTTLAAPAEVQYGYDGLNRLTAANSTRHRYDSGRNRIETIRGGEVTRYLWDLNAGLPDMVAALGADDQVKEFHVYGPGGLLGSMEGTTQRFVHQDFNHNVVALTDDQGNIAAAYAYTPYGLPAGSQGGKPGYPFRFAGGVGVMTDPEGLVYMRARYYDPRIRRFTSADLVPGVLRRPQSLGRYAYGEGFALSKSDPTGLYLERGGEVCVILCYGKTQAIDPRSLDSFDSTTWSIGLALSVDGNVGMASGEPTAEGWELGVRAGPKLEAGILQGKLQFEAHFNDKFEVSMNVKPELGVGPYGNVGATYNAADFLNPDLYGTFSVGLGIEFGRFYYTKTEKDPLLGQVPGASLGTPENRSGPFTSDEAGGDNALLGLQKTTLQHLQDITGKIFKSNDLSDEFFLQPGSSSKNSTEEIGLSPSKASLGNGSIFLGE